MIRLLRIPNALTPSPQAIFWRPVAYFAQEIRKGEDGLDAFDAASFLIGNDLSFDLRHYAGHPDFTVTFYLDALITDVDGIKDAIHRVVTGFDLPESAVAWRRGDSYAAGMLGSPPRMRLGEGEARGLALKIAGRAKDHFASMRMIRDELPRIYPLSNLDKVKSQTRPAEQLWHQIVRNVVSHKGSGNSLFSRKLAVRAGDGLRVTEAGLTYLKSVGFLD